ncbi:MAG: glycosyltransferase family 2 protein [bacterium]|nr:glycosyltransferase family 2 protein [bacterium]
MTDVGIVVVTYNSESVIAACLAEATARGDEVVVVDNASADRTLEQVRRFPGVTLIANRTNRGFAAAVNQGASATETELILLLNPDVELLDDLLPLVEACRDNNVAAATGKLIGRDGRPQAGFNLRRLPTPWMLAFEVLGVNHLWPGNSLNRRYRCLDLDPGVEADVEQPPAAFAMIRRDVWRAVGGMDEQFHPLWYEDVDLFRRIAGLGYRVRYVPSVAARHTGAHSIKKLSYRCRQLYWYDSLLKYASKHFATGGRIFTHIAVMFAAVLRMFAEAARHRRLGPFDVYASVIRIAMRSLLGRPRRIAAAGAVSETTPVRTEK